MVSGGRYWEKYTSLIIEAGLRQARGQAKQAEDVVMIFVYVLIF
jgi:hypothetical protein